ncbi:leucine zipper putative tumor suppressor 2-like [Ostrinia furnacalis]|uniref:leucine zipper putative tumor suppressor 2-like n=1 Tax=Ostrinia furnacalis TaxID=93504 RepID=UPI00103D4021|nr:leucine zipper putative tumor suppressor 2-like [Ostrinia furnacalis]
MSSTITTVLTSKAVVVSEGGSSGIGCTPHARDSAPDSNDSASDYNETLGGSDEDSCVITASLHIPAASVSRARPAPPPRRRSTSGSESSAKRDSAVGSSGASAVGSSGVGSSGASASASGASSPPASPPPAHQAPLRVTLTATGELRRTPDIDRLISLGRERNTSDARAVVLRQHDETTHVRTRASSRQETVRRDEQTVRRDEQSIRREEHSARRDERKEGTTLYKRGELISSAQSPPT